MMKIQIILGSTRPNRASENVAAWVMEEAKKVDELEFELLDLRDFNLPFYDEPKSVKGINGQYAHDEVKHWSKKISEGDGYIFITPEYNHGYSAVLKNALDWLYDEWKDKPAAFVSYGGVAAGTRAVQQLVMVFRELQMVPLKDGAHLPFVWNAFDESGTFKPEYHAPDLKPMFEGLKKWIPLLAQARK